MSGGTARTGTMLAFAAVVGSAFAVTAGVSQLSVRGTTSPSALLASGGCDEPVFPYVQAGCPSGGTVPTPPRKAEVAAAPDSAPSGPKAAPEVPKPLPVLATPIAPAALVTLAAIHVARTEAARADLPVAPASVAAPAPPMDAVGRPASALSPAGPAMSPAALAPAPFLSLPVGPEESKLAAIVASPAAPVPAQTVAGNESRAETARMPDPAPSPEAVPSPDPARTASAASRAVPAARPDAVRAARSRPFEPIDQPRAVGQVAALDAPAAERPDGPPRNVRVIPIDRAPGSAGATVIPAPASAVAAAAGAATDMPPPPVGEAEKSGRPSGPETPSPIGGAADGATAAPGGTAGDPSMTSMEPRPARLSRREQRRLAWIEDERRRREDEQQRREAWSGRVDARRSELAGRLGRIEAERLAREQRLAEREARAGERRAELAMRLDRLRADRVAREERRRADREARLRDRAARQAARAQARGQEAGRYGQADGGPDGPSYDRRATRRYGGEGWYGQPPGRPDQQVYYVRRPAGGILGWLGGTE